MTSYKVKLQCANCGIRIKWFKGIKAWLHLHANGQPDFFQSSACIQYTHARATPTVRSIKKRK